MTTTTTPLSPIAAFFASSMNKMGLISWAATVAYDSIEAYTSHTFSWPITIVGAVTGLVAVLAPDNVAAKTDSAQFVKDGFTLWATKNPAEVAVLISDASKIASDFTPAQKQ